MRVYGDAAPDWSSVPAESVLELSSLKNGGRIIQFNNAHYGDVWALLSEGRGTTMGDGWETRRRRTPGHDWIIIALGAACEIDKIEIDTAHFKGNYPESASVQAAYIDAGNDENLETQSMFWPEVMARKKLGADQIHVFEGDAITPGAPATHVKLNIFPDGGVSRFRVFGRRAK